MTFLTLSSNEVKVLLFIHCSRWIKGNFLGGFFIFNRQNYMLVMIQKRLELWESEVHLNPINLDYNLFYTTVKAGR